MTLRKKCEADISVRTLITFVSRKSTYLRIYD
jgi:hypothetical protein